MKRSLKNEVGKNGFNICLVFIFAALSLFGILHHEIWLDEAQHWLLARDSNSLADLWKNTRYEGHPLLWNLILFGITRFTHDPVWMQIAHWSIAVGAAAVFIFLSPLPRNWNAFFVLGYFMLFEYTMLSRNYSLLLLFFFLSLRFYVTSRYIILGISLFILCNTHLFGLIMAGWLTILILFFDAPKQLDVTESRSKKLTLFIFLAGALLSLAQIAPPGNSPFLPSIGTLFSRIGIERLLAVFLKAFFPIPDLFDYHYWNSNLITGLSKILAGIVSVVVIFATVIIASDTRKSLILFLGTSLSIIAVVITLYPASIVQAARHFGLIFIVLIGSIWIHSSEGKIPHLNVHFPEGKKVIVTALLVIQIIAGCIAYYLDLKRPFSESRNVISFLEQNSFSHKPILTFQAPIPTISAYAQEKTYTIPSGQHASFFSWERTDVHKGTTRITSDLLKEAERFIMDHGNEGILVVYDSIEESEHTQLLKAFTQGVVKTENYYVYLISISTHDND